MAGRDCKGFKILRIKTISNKHPVDDFFFGKRINESINQEVKSNILCTRFLTTKFTKIEPAICNMLYKVKFLLDVGVNKLLNHSYLVSLQFIYTINEIVCS